MSDKLEKDLKDMFDEIPEPEGRRDRAMFVAGVATRRPPPLWRRALMPATAIFVVLFALSLGSLKASPGQTLYPLRNALSSVGIAQEPVEVVDRVIRRAEVSLERAEELLDDNEDFAGAEARTEQTLAHLGEANALLKHLSGEAREDRAGEIGDLNEDAFELLEEIDEERDDAAEDARRESDGRDDSSGPGSGSDDDDDSSGPGSGSDDDDDSSGSGSGGSDDSGSDDSSGPGSGSSGSDDDSSGPGSGSDD